MEHPCRGRYPGFLWDMTRASSAERWGSTTVYGGMLGLSGEEIEGLRARG